MRMLATGLFLLFGLASCGTPSEREGYSQEPIEIDITAEWITKTSDPKAQPTTEYRSGHVTPRTLDSKAVTPTDSGYTISFPGNYPIPTPAFYKGRLYVSGGFGSKQYYCFNAKGGKFVWGIDLDDDGPTSAAIEDDIVVINTESCTIFALNAKTGKMLWSKWLGDPLMTTPTICDGRVYTSYPANAQKGKVLSTHIMGCFDLKTGKILWQKWIDSDVISAPVATKGEIYAATFAGTVFRFKQGTGKIVSVLKARATSAPTVIGDEMAFSRRTDKEGKTREALGGWNMNESTFSLITEEKEALYLDKKVQSGATFSAESNELDAGNGFGGGAPQAAAPEKAADNLGYSSVSSLQAFQGSRILRYARANYACMGDEIVCTDPKTGKSLWKKKLKGDLANVGGFLGAPPVTAGNSIFLATLSGEIMEFEPKKGKVLHRWKVGHPLRFQPIVVGGRVYVGTQNGKMVCIDTGNSKNTGWPMWGANAQRTGMAVK